GDSPEQQILCFQIVRVCSNDSSKCDRRLLVQRPVVLRHGVFQGGLRICEVAVQFGPHGGLDRASFCVLRFDLQNGICDLQALPSTFFLESLPGQVCHAH